MVDRSSLTLARAAAVARRYGVLILIVLLMIALTIQSDAFLTTRNLLNILTQNAPLAIVAMAGTLVIIAGGFDLSTGAIFAVASVSAAWIGLHHDPVLGLVVAPLVGLGLGLINGLIITGLRVHSFLATLATSLVYRGIAVLITGGSLISLTNDTTFAKLGRGKVGEVSYAIFILAAVFAILTFLARRTVAGRHIYAVGGNVDAAVLSGVRVLAHPDPHVRPQRHGGRHRRGDHRVAGRHRFGAGRRRSRAAGDRRDHPRRHERVRR